MGYTQEDITKAVQKQRAYFASGATLDVSYRIKKLKKLKEAVIYYEEEMQNALSLDLGRTPMEAYLCDIGDVVLEINETIKGLKKWAKPEKHFSGLLCFPSITTKVYKMPYGVTLIISPFNFPFLLSLGVLAASIAGGNTAIIKTSSKSVACTEVTKKIIERAFSDEYVLLIDGGHDVADFCLSEKFDKIFYTGSPNVAVHVMSEAAKNLTPVALELGGETGNWCVVRKDADLKDAARKIAFFKILNSGQVCININQVAIAKEVASEFVELLKKEFIRQITTDPINNPEYPRLIGKKAYDKCIEDVNKYQSRVVFGGIGDEKTLKFAPTIIFPVDINEDIVQRELFSPLLPIVTYKDEQIDELIETIEVRQHGLAFYLFTRDIKWANKTMERMQFGGGCINEVVMHLMVKGVPFNGTGHSGMGAYHAQWGFREFTHPKTVLKGSNRFNLSLREHPYTGEKSKKKFALLKFMEK